jgi:hypothetical protein
MTSVPAWKAAGSYLDFRGHQIIFRTTVAKTLGRVSVITPRYRNPRRF